ncbi:hypothetical protein BH11PSE5_BH11PSE5_30700 [soil metagenome]
MELGTLSSNILALRRHLNLNQTAFAELVGSQQASISRWEKGSDEPSARPVGRMAELAGCSVDAFYDVPWSARTAQVGKPPAAIASDQTPTVAAETDTVDIVRLDLSVSMGPGTIIDDYVEASTVKFDLSWLREITRSQPPLLRIIDGIGDSMYPTLNPGDVIIVDTGDRMLSRQDGIYWISVYGASGLKRLRAVGPQRVKIVSDNPGVEDYEVDAEDLQIEGRVVWYARRA